MTPESLHTGVRSAQLEEWLDAVEGERFEFKEAKATFSFDRLVKNCCALANEGGGRLILGVSDRRPRRIVGTAAFLQIEDIRRSLMGSIHLRIDVHTIDHCGKRVLVFEIPSRPVGAPLQFNGIYWGRRADELEPISPDRLREILAESGHDFSSDICNNAEITDLDIEAIEDYRRRWIAKSGNAGLVSISREQLLRDSELLSNEGCTYAALVLFGLRSSLGRLLGQAEVVFEYRSADVSGPAQQRKEYRTGFFAFYEDLWATINLRNDLQHVQDGLFIQDVPTFAERPVREALLNAVSHRDYQLGGSVFIRQYPRHLEVDSPGGLPHTITLENMLDRQSPRNRRIAEVLARCGLVERSGQGLNLMFEDSIRQGKSLPDFTGTDAFHVVVTLHGEVQDSRFIHFLEKVASETQTSFSTRDLMVMEIIHRELPVPESHRPNVARLRSMGIVETIGRGRGVRYILSKQFYSDIGQRGGYTRRRGLDWEESKALLMRHLLECSGKGCQMSEMQQVLPSKSRDHIKRLLSELRKDGKARLQGIKRSAKWYAVSVENGD